MFNGIAMAFQGYKAMEGKTELIGINTDQFIYDGKNWKINSLTWSETKEGQKIPWKNR
ncbi:MAG: hypothetical protein ACI9G9_000853 [Psychromonas sp.]